MNNPIIQREFIGTLRSPRALAAMVVVAAALAALVLVRWPSEARVDLSGGQARQVLRVFGYGLMTVLILLAPVFPATSIVRERVQGTLALLLNSPMNPWAIVIGKLVGVIGFVALLLALSLPAAAACFAMGGIGLTQLGAIYAVLFMLSLMYATLGLLVSSYAHSVDAALRMTYGVILLLAVVSMGPYAFLQGRIEIFPMQAVVIDWLRCLSPIPAVMDVLGDSGIGAAGQQEVGSPALRFCIIALIASAVFTVWTASRMNQRLFDEARDSGKVTDEQSAKVQAYRRIMYLWFFDPQRRGDLIGVRYGLLAAAAAVSVVAVAAAAAWFSVFSLEGTLVHTLMVVTIGSLLGFVGLVSGASVLWMAVGANPAAVKEQKCNRFGRGHWMMRLIGACLIVSLGLMLLASIQSMGMGPGRLGGIMVLLQVALIILVTPAMAAGLISTERESRGWQLLQMTPMSSVTIVAGKLMSVALTVLLILGATLPGYAVLIAISPGQQATVINVLISLVLTAVMAILVSAAISSLFKQTAAATATAYGVLLGLCAGTLLFWLAQDAPFTAETVEAVLLVNPLAAALSLINAPGFADYDLVPMNWWITGGISAAALLVLVVQTWRLTRPR